jgi:hypothetical protein
MQDFWLWFTTGITHITDLAGYDHILFLMVLCVPYSWQNGKQLLWLITAFTIGHSLSLALSVLGIVKVESSAVEWLIALSILILALQNMMRFGLNQSASKSFQYGLTTLFGLIHGLGFSTLLRAMLGKTESLAMPLFSFNLGLEFGQIMILLAILAFGLLWTNILRWPDKYRNLSFSTLALVLSLIMLVDRFPQLKTS